ncbi:MAG: Protein grpE [Deltaproteobacteria bacterium]|nr:Protein grpE [Deltaproteobacteria bacterium]
MSGKSKQQSNEKEEQKSKGNNHSGINIVVGDNQESKAKGENQPEGTAEKKDLTPAEKIQKQLEEKTREASEYFDKWIRLQAEFENYKKRIQREKSDQMKFGNEALLRAFLPVLDNLERAIGHGKETREAAPLLAGVEITLKQFLNTLEQFGVKPILAVGEVFDPEKHEAISQMESDLESNRVVSEVQKGYVFHERLLRPAKVIVSKSKARAEEEMKADV